MKINITSNDYTFHGVGFNGWNFVHNVVPRISRWLVEEYHKNNHTTDEAALRNFVDKLNRIAEIIDE